jgi:hypothetical protein
MNEEPIEPSQDDLRYDELFECSHDELVKKLMSCEDALTNWDEELDKAYAANESMIKQLDDLRLENKAIADQLYEAYVLIEELRQSVAEAQSNSRHR